MKTKTAVVIFLTIALAVMAGTNPVNFTGTWNFDKEKSEMGEGGRMGMAALKLTITQDEKQLSVERFISSEFAGDFTFNEKVTLDGKETVNSSDFGERILTATWSEDGKTLTIKSVMEMNREGETFQMKSTEIWTLIEDGAVLKIDQTRMSPRGERKSVLQYNKEQIQK